MIILNVPDMSCGHCAGVITKALKALDPQASIGYDMHNRQVQVDTRQAPQLVLQAMADAGYPATVTP